MSKKSTKYCPACGADKLHMLPTHELKVCQVCGKKFEWKREEGEPSYWEGGKDK